MDDNPQSEPKPIGIDELKNYLHRMIVVNTRGYTDYEYFSKTVFAYLEEHQLLKKDMVFVSNGAKTGTSAMIVRFAKEHQFAWIEFHANWDDIDAPGAKVRLSRKTGRPYNAMADFVCNEEMAEVGTRLLIFYDGVSSDTDDILDRMTKRGNLCRVVLVTIEK